MSKIKWNYAVMRSIFGDLWVGKTKLKPVKEKIFADIKDAIENAKALFLEAHPAFDPDDDEEEENNPDTWYEWDKLDNILENIEDNPVEEIKKKMEKFIVN